MKTKRIAAFAAAAAMILGVCGCSNNSESADGNNSGDKQLEELTVVLDWYPNGSHVFLYDAIEEGYYEEEGLKIKV